MTSHADQADSEVSGVVRLIAGPTILVQSGVNTTTEIRYLYHWQELYTDFRRDSLEILWMPEKYL
jgi:hypothetical protein